MLYYNMAEVSITQRQLNELAKGRPIQVSYSGLTSQSPNTTLHGLGIDAQKRIRRALSERRGVRLKLQPEEIQGLKTTLNGGKINWDWLDPKKNGVAKAFEPVKKVFTKDIPHVFRNTN